MARDLGYEGTFDADGGGVGGNFVGPATGWGDYLAGLRRLAPEGGLHASLAYGEGITNYANDGGVDLASADDLKPVAVPFFLWHLSYGL